MTKKLETYKLDKNLDCESVSTTHFWYAKGEYKEVNKLTSPHLCNILEFMYKRANYKRNNAIRIMCNGLERWKTPYYERVAKSTIISFCYEHFHTYSNITHILFTKRRYTHSSIPTPKKLGIQDESPYTSYPNESSYLYMNSSHNLGQQQQTFFNEGQMTAKKTQLLIEIGKILDKALK